MNYTPQQIGAMRMASRSLQLTASPSGCTIAGKSAEDVRKLTDLSPNTAGIIERRGDAFVARLGAGAEKNLPFLPWNTAGRMGRPRFIRDATREGLMRKIARGVAKFGPATMAAPRRLPNGAWEVAVPDAWVMRARRRNSAAGPGNTAGAEGDICAAGLHWEWSTMMCELGDDTSTGEGNTDVGGDPPTDIDGPPIAGSPCQLPDGSIGLVNMGGFCVPHAGGGTGTGGGGGPIVIGGGGGTPVVVPPPPVVEESFFSKYKYEIGGVLAAVTVVAAGIYLGKKKGRKKNPPTKGKKSKKRSKKK